VSTKIARIARREKNPPSKAFVKGEEKKKGRKKKALREFARRGSPQDENSGGAIHNNHKAQE